mmetsp:Transcript_26700/g.39672  ORF Transcript_26700/g.39672 Transcript_26700/m.39672 type:complete len:86 (+) Transcript_26700:58-315(+)
MVDEDSDNDCPLCLENELVERVNLEKQESNTDSESGDAVARVTTSGASIEESSQQRSPSKNCRYVPPIRTTVAKEIKIYVYVDGL